MRARSIAFMTLIATSICLSFHHAALASVSGLESAGTLVLFALPATGGALTIVHHDGQGAGQLASSLAVTAGFTMVLKYAIDEERPNGDKHSFPSGHASLAFSAAEFMRVRYGWRWGAPAVAAAAFVAYSRVESRQHYVHDVVVGAGIGFVTSMLLTKPCREWKVSVLTGRQTIAFGLWRRL